VLLRDYLGTKAPGQPVGPGDLKAASESWWLHAAVMVKADLEVASIPYHDETGRVFDFRALRHQFISNLAAGGVHPKIAQVLARHSTITLTMDHYTTHFEVH